MKVLKLLNEFHLRINPKEMNVESNAICGHCFPPQLENHRLNMDLYDRLAWLIIVIVTMRLIDACAVISGDFVVGVLKSVYCSLKAIGLSLQALVSVLTKQR